MNACSQGLLVAVVVVWSSAPSLPGQDDRARFVAAARGTARWLRSVERDERGLTWPDAPAVSGRSTRSLYSGDAGVILFHLALHERTKDPDALARARRGARSLIAAAEWKKSKPSCGYFTGIAGQGLVLLELWRHEQTHELRDAVLAVVRSLDGAKQENELRGSSTIRWGPSNDVISGSAGIGFFLLEVHEALGDERALVLAVRAADGLIAGGERLTGTGVRWSASEGLAREYPNYSHGTAGVADYLLRLHEVLSQDAVLGKRYGARKYLSAAFEGARYLRSLAGKPAGLILHHQPGGEDLHYLGWCHGPAGTGPFLRRMSAQTKNDALAAVGAAGVRALLDASLHEKRHPGFWNNVGVCCGSAGVASYLLDRFVSTGDEALRDEALRLMDDVLRRATRHDGGALSWSQAEHRVRPELLRAQTGLMQGAAGIGLALLKTDAVLHERPFPWCLPMIRR